MKRIIAQPVIDRRRFLIASAGTAAAVVVGCSPSDGDVDTRSAPDTTAASLTSSTTEPPNEQIPLTSSTTEPPNEQIPLTPELVSSIAEEAYTFAFPMLMGYRVTFGTFLFPSLPSYRGPLNGVYGTAVTLGPSFKDVVTPNADTPYSMAGLDLRAEPLVLEVPAVTDRYYVMQFVDLFGTNPHFVGSRATGAEAGTYLLVGPGYSESIPDGFTDVLRFETDLVVMIGRTQLLAADDLEATAAIMAAYRLETLSTYQGVTPLATEPIDWPIWNDEASRDERFIGYVNLLLALCQPPDPSEVEIFDRFSRIGIGAGIDFDSDSLDDERRAAIRAGIDTARATIEDNAKRLENVNGWVIADAFGARDFFDGDYALRAAGAMAGWGGNNKIEAFYPLSREDGNGQPLDGANKYSLQLQTPPPANAFWSVTIYDTSYDGLSGYLVDNPIDRYLINGSTQGLAYGDDGSLFISIQHDEPSDSTEKANWLPAPEGAFYLVMRIYWPTDDALDGTWTPPAVRAAI